MKESIAKLPDELLLIILQYLPLKDLINASEVSTRWRELIQDDSLWLPFAKRYLADRGGLATSLDKLYGSNQIHTLFANSLKDQKTKVKHIKKLNNKLHSENNRLKEITDNIYDAHKRILEPYSLLDDATDDHYTESPEPSRRYYALACFNLFGTISLLYYVIRESRIKDSIRDIRDQLVQLEAALPAKNTLESRLVLQ